jgi:hypothetical protein
MSSSGGGQRRPRPPEMQETADIMEKSNKNKAHNHDPVAICCPDAARMSPAGRPSVAARLPAGCTQVADKLP